jgi:AmmeMemoRadiSam system protein B/AmmeMemoRadiSam system protein A
VAGLFYPAEPERLRATLQALLAEARLARGATVPRPPKILVVPHAGYVYSGPIAAAAYALLAPWHDTVKRVVLLGPTHRVAVRGIAAPEATAFETPLGAVPVDREALATLAALPQTVASDTVHANEHAIEVQLPFLQSVLDEFTLVPLAVGRATPDQVAELIEQLWGGDETLVVISTDLSHYLTHAEARAVDADTIAHVLQLDPALDHAQACGATPLAAALQLARRHGLRPRLLDLRNSGDTAGDRERVVGYASLAFEEAMAWHEADPTGRLRDALLARARNAIAGSLGLATGPEPDHPALHRPGASFVTLHRHGALRGCIGRLEAGAHSLEVDVRRNARSAAFEDPRFTPLTADEWDGLTLEVSLIGEAEPLPARSEAEALAQLRPGVDGVILAWRGHRATFLPQVWQQLPAPALFLAALKQKAGLQPDHWDADLHLSRYTVQVFDEADEPAPRPAVH